LKAAPGIRKEHETELADHHIEASVSARQILAVHHDQIQREPGDLALRRHIVAAGLRDLGDRQRGQGALVLQRRQLARGTLRDA
jgi:hypothetical protein